MLCMCQVKFYSIFLLKHTFYGRYDIQHNDTQHNGATYDTQHK
jgi:hypothetical protein